MRAGARGLGAIGVVAVSIAVAAPAAAKKFEVTKRSDPTPNGCKKKDCSLREAVIAANAHSGSDKVVLPKKKTYGLSIENSIPPGEDEAAEGDLDITDPLRVTHPGRGRAKIDANGVDRVFEVLAGATTFQKLVIRGGDEPSGPDGFGGGIRSQADLVLQRTKVIDNRTVDDDGGGIGYPNGDSSLTLRRSSVSRNVSGDDGGGLSFDEEGPGKLVISRSKFTDNEASDWGGGLITAVDATINRTTFSGNEAIEGTGGGAAIEIPDARISNSTFSANSAGEFAGGLDANSDASITVVNTTISGNHAEDDGGGLWVDNGSPASLNAVTVARNSSAQFGGGLFSDTQEPFEVENSLIALNGAALGGDDCSFDDPGDEFDSLGHNLIGDDTGCDGFDAVGDFVDPNPKLGQLKSNGGPTQTIALKKGSPAINKADKQSAPKKDQRGVKRGKKPDIGAYERVKKKKRHHHR